jgi:hypothetical protein
LFVRALINRSAAPLMMEETMGQPTTPAAVELTGREDEDWHAAATAGRTQQPPPPLTHDDNRSFLRMLRDMKEK